MMMICIDRAIQGMGEWSRRGRVTSILLGRLLRIRGGGGNEGRLKYVSWGLTDGTGIRGGGTRMEALLRGPGGLILCRNGAMGR